MLAQKNQQIKELRAQLKGQQEEDEENDDVENVEEEQKWKPINWSQKNCKVALINGKPISFSLSWFCH